MTSRSASHPDQTPMGRFAAFGNLNAAEAEFLRAMIANGRTEALAKGADIRSSLGPARGIYFLQKGWISASALLSNGRMHVFKIHLPSDVLGAPSLAFEEPVETLITLTSSEVTFIPTSEIRRMFRECPALAFRIFLGAQQERMFLMDRLATSGQLSAKQAIAAFLVDLHHRMERAQLTDSSRICTPVTQEHIGQVLGLSEVHVNRVVSSLIKCGLVAKISRGYDLLDVDRLRKFSQTPERRLAEVDASLFDGAGELPEVRPTGPPLARC